MTYESYNPNPPGKGFQVGPLGYKYDMPPPPPVYHGIAHDDPFLYHPPGGRHSNLYHAPYQTPYENPYYGNIYGDSHANYGGYGCYDYQYRDAHGYPSRYGNYHSPFTAARVPPDPATPPGPPEAKPDPKLEELKAQIDALKAEIDQAKEEQRRAEPEAEAEAIQYKRDAAEAEEDEYAARRAERNAARARRARKLGVGNKSEKQRDAMLFWAGGGHTEDKEGSKQRRLTNRNIDRVGDGTRPRVRGEGVVKRLFSGRGD